MDKDWNKMNADERRQARYARWKKPEKIEFVSPQVKQNYSERIQRVIDAIELKKTPDRVPTLSPAGFLPCFLYGVSCKDVMYDIDIAMQIWERFALEYPTDLIKAPSNQGAGFAKALEILDYQLYKWPGNGLADNVGFQALESEWMKSDEYDVLLDDPSDLWLRRYLPRVFNALAPLTDLTSLTNIVELPNILSLSAFGRPGVRDALNLLVDAGEELLNVRIKMAGFVRKAIGALGFGLTAGGGAKAPFDVLADTMRASRGMMMDMYRCVEKIAPAVERIIPLQIKNAVAAVDVSGNPLVFMPLHKGADGFMSDEQFSRLYWPGLKAVIEGLIEQGCVPFVFAEGGFNSRLDYLNELPKGTTVWWFDKTDMAEAKKKVGGTICMAGNVPTSLMITGAAAQVEERCKQLIDDCAPGGGYILTTGAGIDEGNAATTEAFIQAAEKYGQYA
jgi:hypothetical protein